MSMRIALAVGAALLTPACVQPAYDRTVVYRVDVSRVADVRAVGVRGSDQPLSWDTDLALTPIPDSVGLYGGAVTYRTGSLRTEVKFTANGTFELQNAPNRIVRLVPTTRGNDTTVVRVTFDVP